MVVTRRSCRIILRYVVHSKKVALFVMTLNVDFIHGDYQGYKYVLIICVTSPT